MSVYEHNTRWARHYPWYSERIWVSAYVYDTSIVISEKQKKTRVRENISKLIIFEAFKARCVAFRVVVLYIYMYKLLAISFYTRRIYIYYIPYHTAGRVSVSSENFRWYALVLYPHVWTKYTNYQPNTTTRTSAVATLIPNGIQQPSAYGDTKREPID